MRLRGSLRLLVVVLLVALLAAGSAFAAMAGKPPPPQGSPFDFAKWTSLTDFGGGTFARTKSITAQTGVPGDGSVVLDPAVGLLSGTDTTGMYNGGSYLYGTYTSPIRTTASAFNWAVASWDAKTPAGTWTQVELRVQAAGVWSKYYNMGVWAIDTGTISRHSVNGQGDKTATVATDTLTLSRSTATAYQYRVTLFTTNSAVTPELGLVSVIAYNTTGALATVPPDTSVWGKELAVPERSQMDYLPDGSGWCSPTSTSMVMAYWGGVTGNSALVQTVPTVAAGCYDYTYGGTGNWPFNPAYASGYGLEGFVSRFQSMSQVEQWIKRDIPVVIGIAFSNGELTGAPVSSTPGHLIVIRGFDANGNVICNDPAADRTQGEVVRIVYNRAQLEHVWLTASGVVYLMYQPGWTTPPTDGRGNWQ